MEGTAEIEGVSDGTDVGQTDTLEVKKKYLLV